MAYHDDFWTPERDAKLIGMRRDGFSWAQIAHYFGRHKCSVQAHLRVALRQAEQGAKSRPWTEEENALLFKLREQGLQWVEIAERIGRTAAACSSRCKWLRSKGRGGEENPVVEVRQHVSRDMAERLLPKTYWRKCHECGKLTPHYRCDKCREKWKLKHHVEEDEENQGGFDG